MNRIYKVVWNKAKTCYVAASELAKRNTKGSGARFLGRAAVTWGIVAGLSLGISGSAWAGVTIDLDAIKSISNSDSIAFGYQTYGDTGKGDVSISVRLSDNTITSSSSGIKVNAGNGLDATTSGLAVKAGNGINVTADGVAVRVDDATITVSSNGISVDTSGKIVYGNTGVVSGGTVFEAVTFGTLGLNGDTLTSQGNTTVGGTLAVTGDYSTTDGNITTTNGTITGKTVTDGTATMTGGAMTGVTTITATGQITSVGLDAGAGGVSTTGNIRGLNVTASGMLAVTGTTTLNDTLAVKGDTKVGDNFTVTAADGSMSAADGNFTVDASGNTAAAGTLKVTGATTLNDALTVKGDTKVGDHFTVTAADGSMSAAGGKFTVDASGNTAAKGTLDVAKATKLGSTLDVTGATTLGSTLNVTGATATNGITNTGDVTTDTLTTTGNATVGGTLEVKGDTKVGDHFTVKAADGSMSAAGGNFTVDASGNTAAKGTLDVAKATKLGSTLDVTGATTLKDTLDVTGATTLGSTLKVTGATTTNGITNTGDVTTDTLTTTGNATVGGTLGVTGDTKVGDHFTVTAADGSMSAAGGNFTSDKDGNVAAAGTLDVKGDAVLNSNLTVGGEALFNKGKANQVIIDESGIRIGLHSGQVDDEGFYAGGHDWGSAAAAFNAQGEIKGAGGAFMVNTEGAVTAKSYGVGDNVYIDSEGLNANYQTIRNVAPGQIAPGSADAVSGGQLYNVREELQTDINRVGAGAAAMANLRPVDMGNKLSVAMGIGNYRSKTAMAMGLFYKPSDRVMLNMSSTVGNGHNMIGAGISFALDKVAKPAGGAATNAEVENLRAENAEIKAQLEELKAVVAAMKAAK